MVKGGEKSSRVSLAEKTFYAHNYRIYLLGKGDALILLSDVFNQHRRLHSQLDLTHLIAELVTDWPTVELSALLKNLEDLKFATRYLEAYALLAHRISECKERFFKFLLEDKDEYPPIAYHYSLTYLGVTWSHPIHLALLADRYPSRAEEWLTKLKYWQEKSSYMSQIGPHWGLSRDYDSFIALDPHLCGQW